jgi:photosystem II stability/assembly factor-like uncharacterized protein
MRYLIPLFSFMLFFPLVSFSQWIPLNSGTTNNLYATDFYTPNLGLATGNSRYVMRTIDGGLHWEQVYDFIGGNDRWNSIQMIDDQNIYACGTVRINDRWRYGWAFSHDGGENWTSKTSWNVSYNNSSYSDVFYLNENKGWRVGYYKDVGKVFANDSGVNDDWTELSTIEEATYLSSVFFLDELEGWIVGSPGYIAKSVDGGEEWLPMESNTDKLLRDIFFIDKNTGWVVGYKDDQAIVLNTDDGGINWQSIYPESVSSLNSVYFISTQEGWACGSIQEGEEKRGVILSTKDGGINWEVEHVENTCSSLADLSFRGGVAYAVGSEGVILKMIYGDDFLQFNDKKEMLRKKCAFGYATDGAFLYASGGQKPSPFNDYFISEGIQRYNPEYDNWIDWVDGLVPRNFGSTLYLPGMQQLCILNGEAYSPGYYSDSIELVDVNTKSITYRSGNPFPVKKAGAAVWRDKVYIFGGNNADGFSKRFYEYDPNSDSWERLADLPEPKETVGCIVDDVLYVVGGQNYFSSKKIHAYDLVNKSWSHVADLPMGLHGHSLARSGKYIWVLGSEEAPAFTGLFNTDSHELEEKYSNLMGRKHAGAAVVNDHLYVFGGRVSDEYQGIINGVQELDVHNFSGLDIQDAEAKRYEMSPNPNPFTSVIHFPLKDLPLGSKELLIYDSYGRVVKTFSTKEKDLYWKADAIEAGTYYYQVFVNKEFCASGKVLKLK